MISQDERRLVLICVVVLLASVLTMEYAYILCTWRNPIFGYRILLGTHVVCTVCSEIERVFGEGLLMYVPRTVGAVIAVNFAFFEGVMLLKRNATKSKRRIYVDEDFEFEHPV